MRRNFSVIETDIGCVLDLDIYVGCNQQGDVMAELRELTGFLHYEADPGMVVSKGRYDSRSDQYPVTGGSKSSRHSLEAEQLPIRSGVILV